MQMDNGHKKCLRLLWKKAFKKVLKIFSIKVDISVY